MGAIDRLRGHIVYFDANIIIYINRDTAARRDSPGGAGVRMQDC